MYSYCKLYSQGRISRPPFLQLSITDKWKFEKKIYIYDICRCTYRGWLVYSLLMPRLHATCTVLRVESTGENAKKDTYFHYSTIVVYYHVERRNLAWLTYICTHRQLARKKNHVTLVFATLTAGAGPGI